MAQAGDVLCGQHLEALKLEFWYQMLNSAGAEGTMNKGEYEEQVQPLRRCLVVISNAAEARRVAYDGGVAAPQQKASADSLRCKGLERVGF